MSLKNTQVYADELFRDQTHMLCKSSVDYNGE